MTRGPRTRLHAGVLPGVAGRVPWYRRRPVRQRGGPYAPRDANPGLRNARRGAGRPLRTPKEYARCRVSVTDVSVSVARPAINKAHAHCRGLKTRPDLPRSGHRRCPFEVVCSIGSDNPLRKRDRKVDQPDLSLGSPPVPVSETRLALTGRNTVWSTWAAMLQV